MKVCMQVMLIIVAWIKSTQCQATWKSAQLTPEEEQRCCVDAHTSVLQISHLKSELAKQSQTIVDLRDELLSQISQLRSITVLTTPTQAPTTRRTAPTITSTRTPATTQTSTITPPGLPNNGNFFPRHPDKVPTFIPTGWAAYPGRQIDGSFTLIENVADGDTCFNACVTNLLGTCYAVEYDNAYSQCWMFITDGTDIGEACHPLKPNSNMYHIKRNACPNPYESPFVYGA